MRSFQQTTLGFHDGKHYTEYVEQVKELRRTGRDLEAEDLLLSLLSAVEEEAMVTEWGFAPWYFEQLAIIYRKRKDYASEIAILDQFIASPIPEEGNKDKWHIIFAARVEKARLLLSKSDGSVP